MNVDKEFAKYLKTVAALKRVHPEWRAGQAYFNVLLEGKTKLAERIRGTSLDPFHMDGVIPTFLEYVLENWIGEAWYEDAYCQGCSREWDMDKNEIQGRHAIKNQHGCITEEYGDITVCPFCKWCCNCDEKRDAA